MPNFFISFEQIKYSSDPSSFQAGGNTVFSFLGVPLPLWALLKTLGFFQTFMEKQTHRKGHKKSYGIIPKWTHPCDRRPNPGREHQRWSRSPGHPPGPTLPVPTDNTVLTARTASQGLPLLIWSVPCHPAALDHLLPRQALRKGWG